MIFLNIIWHLGPLAADDGHTEKACLAKVRWPLPLNVYRSSSQSHTCDDDFIAVYPFYPSLTSLAVWPKLRMNWLIAFSAKVHWPFISKIDPFTHWVVEILFHEKSTLPTKLHYQWILQGEAKARKSIISQSSVMFDVWIWPLTLLLYSKTNMLVLNSNPSYQVSSLYDIHSWRYDPRRHFDQSSVTFDPSNLIYHLWSLFQWIL